MAGCHAFPKKHEATGGRALLGRPVISTQEAKPCLLAKHLFEERPRARKRLRPTKGRERPVTDAPFFSMDAGKGGSGSRGLLLSLSFVVRGVNSPPDTRDLFMVSTSCAYIK